MKVNMSNQLRK